MAKKGELARVRNIGIIAHIDAGKTTMTERILYYTGFSHAMGTVDDGNTVTDWMDQEKERGITITSATITCQWRDHKINIIDTPGHVDFTAEVERALRVLDGAVLVLDAVNGVEPQSEAVWNQAHRYHVPRMVVVNKMDKVGADFASVVADVEEKLQTTALPIHWPIGAEDTFTGVVDLVTNEALVWDRGTLGADFRREPVPDAVAETAQSARERLLEMIAGEDEALLERYVAGEPLTPDELRAGLRRLVLSGTVTPMLASAALRNMGVQPAIDAIVDYLPAPFEVPPTTGRDADDEVRTFPSDPNGALAALVFKTYTDATRRRVNYARVYSGTLTAGDRVRNASKDEEERVARLFMMQADRQKRIDELAAGEIGVVVGLKHATTGDTICAIGDDFLLERMVFPEPVVSAALETRSAGEEGKLISALDMLAVDDPTFQTKLDESTGQRIISGMGELHLEVIAARLEREFNLPVRLGKPQVEYRESITRPATGAAEYVRQMAGKENHAVVEVALDPLPAGSGNTFESRIEKGALPPPLLAVVEASALGALSAGIIGGYRVLGVAVALMRVVYREEVGTDLAFAAATRSAVKDALAKGAPLLLEPTMRLEILAPRDFVGGVLTGLAARKGRVESTDIRGQLQIVTARVPLSRMFGYATELRSATQGRATYSMRFDRFEPAAE